MQKVAHPPDEFFLDARADAKSVVVRLAERRHRAVSPVRGPRHVQLELTATGSLFTFVAAEGEG